MHASKQEKITHIHLYMHIGYEFCYGISHLNTFYGFFLSW